MKKRRKNNMTTIKAPFNFVPVSDNVFFPDWADKISHDIPFEDGESGTIELKITAESPVFVRNGHTKQDAENKTDNYKSFSNLDGKYFIPATSIKGAVRNVLEIISSSKMSNIANTRYSLRDLQLKRDYLNFFQNSDVYCGWMTKNEDEITITNHGIPKRISHEDLDNIWGTDFSETFKNSTLLRLNCNRTAKYKIEKAEGKKIAVRYDEFEMNSVNAVDKRVIAKVSTNGKYEGTIVLTGQPSARKDRALYPDKTVKHKGSGKCYEFVFPSQNLGIVKKFDLGDELYNDFCFIYKDSEDWKYWKNKLDNKEAVPIFFSLANSELIHFGLSYLYKLPYKKRTKDCLPDNHKIAKMDLSECIFGTAQESNPLKGRVQFSHAFIEGEPIVKEQLEAYMGSPKSSYYPIYLQQEGENGYMTNSFITMMSDKARLKGWKRYPIRDDLMTFTIPDGQEENVSPFIPVEKGSVFRCKIRFHNLRKAEIGALLKAIHFNNKGFHSLGFAKAYGYGKVKIESELANCRFLKDEYIFAFTSLIPNYTKSQELRELVLMSETQKLTSPLEYMELPYFVECKRQKRNREGELEKTGEYLQYYSHLIKKDVVQPQKVEAKAEVTLVQGLLIKAKLLGDNIQQRDSGFITVKVDGSKRPKKGNKINVEIVRKGGNIDYLRFKSIVK
jgi:CRISPR-associated protein (TIGR03986 family)